MPYSTRFWAVHDASGGGGPSYTVPAGRIAVLRSLDVYYGGAGQPSAVLTLDDIPIVIVYFAWSLLSPGSRTWVGRQVVNAGETFRLDASDAMDTICSGYLLATG